MAGPNVGFATLSIIPSARGFQRKLQSEIGGALDGATKQLSSGRGTMDKLASAGGAIVSVMGKAAKAVGGLGIVTAGLALKGGFDRALAIEDAQAKLRGLGHSAEAIEGIMESALASVKGTAFGLGDATGLAATMVASGIKPGEELTRVLGLVADTSTVAGVGLDDMGLIWGKVAAKGRVDGQVVNQMLERQIPILEMLAAHYGVTAAEASEMVSKGKVSFEDFAAAMEENVAGAALESGSTTRGAWSNMFAALSRVGEGFVKEMLPLIRTGLARLTEFFDRLGPKVAEVAQAFGGWLRDVLPKVGEFASDVGDLLAPAIERVADFITNTLMPGLVNFGRWLIEHRPILIGVGVAIGTFMVAALTAYTVAMLKAAAATLMGMAPWIAIGTVIAAVTAGVIYAYQNWDWFRTAVDTVARFLTGTLWPVLQSVASFLAGAFTTAIDAVTTAATWLWRNVLSPAISWISGTLWPIISGLASGPLRAFKNIFDDVATAASWLWDNVLKPVGSWLRDTFKGIVDNVTSAWDALYGVIDKVAGFASSAFSGLVSAINTLIGPLQTAVGLARSLYNGIKDALRIGGSVPGSMSFVGAAVAQLDKYHTGGIVPGPRGSERLAVLEAGEAVFTRSQQRVLGGMINSSPSSAHLDYDAMGRAVAAALRAEPPVTRVVDVADGLRTYDRSLR